jgi:hypothetical protein
MLASAPLVLLVLTVAGCGGGGGAEKEVGGTVPDCVDVVRGKDLPTTFPQEFPLPESAVVASEYTESGARVTELFIRGELEAARDYYKEELPKAGFELGEGDAEEQEAETEFDGHGYEGHLKLHTIEGCENAVSLRVVLRPES